MDKLLTIAEDEIFDEFLEILYSYEEMQYSIFKAEYAYVYMLLMSR